MILIAFVFGLALGTGFWLWQYTQVQQKLRHLLQTLQVDSAEVSLPLVSLLRREITQRIQQQQQLQEQLQTWQTQLQVAPIGYLQVDEENQLLWCNRQAQQLLGLQKWEPGQVRLLLEFVRSYELDQLIEQTREQQQPEVREWVFHPASADANAISGLRSLTLCASSWPLSRGQIGIFLENRQPVVELAQSRDRWVSDLAHELRTPLTSIRLVVETLQDQSTPSTNRLVDRLIPEVDRLINLVQNWLELSQLELNSGKQLNYQSVELRSLIYAVWQTLEPLSQPDQVNLTYTGPDSVWLTADKSRLYRVLLNLLDNSIKYGPPQGTIQVVVNLLPNQTDPQRVQIQIIDSGSGFPTADLPRVFERLYRGDPARARQPISSGSYPNSVVNSGSGLGLAIVQQIVLAHKGTVEARNHPETGGAWLTVELPNLMADFRN